MLEGFGLLLQTSIDKLFGPLRTKPIQTQYKGMQSKEKEIMDAKTDQLRFAIEMSHPLRGRALHLY